MTKVQEINVKDTTIRTLKVGEVDYICITDIARQKNQLEPNAVVGNWMRNRNAIEYLGIWEYLNNPSFNPIEFEGFKQQAGLNAFTLSPSRWIDATNAIGLISKSGRYGGTYAQRDIAFKFASWVSVEFELYLIYAEEADVLNVKKVQWTFDSEAENKNFGMTAKEWRETNPGKKGNMRDYVTINQLICLSNMEYTEREPNTFENRNNTVRNLNAVFINEGIPQRDRLHKLNKIAIQHMKNIQWMFDSDLRERRTKGVLEEVGNRKLLK